MFGQQRIDGQLMFGEFCFRGDRENALFEADYTEAGGGLEGLTSVVFDMLRGKNPDALPASVGYPSAPIGPPGAF